MAKKGQKFEKYSKEKKMKAVQMNLNGGGEMKRSLPNQLKGI
ncbi:hypothetical protein [Bacillus sp. ISL-4]|nr:hypothetical protein [Bacillus sp. ISL-4]